MFSSSCANSSAVSGGMICANLGFIFKGSFTSALLPIFISHATAGDYNSKIVSEVLTDLLLIVDSVAEQKEVVERFSVFADSDLHSVARLIACENTRFSVQKAANVLILVLKDLFKFVERPLAVVGEGGLRLLIKVVMLCVDCVHYRVHIVVKNSEVHFSFLRFSFF